MPGERRNQAWRGRSQAEGCPLAAVSDPALGGSASTRHRPPPTNGWTAPQLLTELRATLRTAAPAQSHLSMPSQYPPTVRGHTFPISRTGWAGWLAMGSVPTAAPHPKDMASHPRAPGDGEWGVGPRVCTCPAGTSLTSVWIKLKTVFITELFWPSLKREWDFSRSLSC